MTKTALITGASAGIGREFARLYAKKGHDLVLVARRLDRLEALKQELEAQYHNKFHIIIADLAKADATTEIIKNLNENSIKIDVLINNAGFGLPGTYQDTIWQQQSDFIQLMVTAPAELSHYLFKSMLENNYGRIINVASLAGLIPGSLGHTLYSASKAFMIKASQSLNLEGQGKNVHVCALCPGFTYSEFHDVNGTRHLISKLPKFMVMSAQNLVEFGYDAVEANISIKVPGIVNNIIYWVTKILPNWLLMILSKNQSKNFRAGHK